MNNDELVETLAYSQLMDDIVYTNFAVHGNKSILIHRLNRKLRTVVLTAQEDVGADRRKNTITPV